MANLPPVGHVRVKTSARRKAGSARWLSRQLNDPYVKQAKAKGYRSRAAFKLLELNARFHLLDKAAKVVDLGCAPGGWAQAILELRPQAHVVALDLLPVEPLAGVTFAQMDFMSDEAPLWLETQLGGKADVVVSDLAANTVGHKQTDHLRTMGLVEAALDFACHVLKPDGAFVAKVFAGGADGALITALKQNFKTVKHAKPPASRKESSEWYVVAQGFKGKGV
jgi:23S rRNA (uridine2552-2'-O)-methyltransferase